ncbi:MAG TPA: DegQ family serine endoprotease [Casimicrobiaceae bacterium]|nr:DegQ family serine endoprotease [Casimicrobiaceae bacterium]
MSRITLRPQQAARATLAFACAVLANLAFAQITARAGLPDFTELYEKQGPSVVSIDVTQKIRRSARNLPDLPEDDPFYEFFKRFGPQFRRSPEPEIAQAAGSGFIIGSDGYIVTNAHVVDGADEVKVTLTDKREFTAKVIGVDKRSDIALIKIEGSNLPKVTIGDPDKLKVGEWVVAIGKPFGLENTMTAGIVSAKGRDLPQENLVPFIQTDVAINPGNSGGPLFNMRGEVVGVNSLIFSRTGGFMGLAFAIPIDVAMNTASQLKDKGRVTRGRIGVGIQEVTKDVAESMNFKQGGGALVGSVEKGGPADKAGIEPGDVIVKVDGRDVHGSADLPRVISAIRPGTKITITVWRKNATRDVAVTVSELKDDNEAPQRRSGGGPSKEQARPNRMGLVLADLTDDQKKDLEVKNGVGVEAVSGAVRANIQAGDVILAVVSRGVTTDARNVAQLNDLFAKLDKSTPVTLQVKRGDNQFFATLRPLPPDSE